MFTVSYLKSCPMERKVTGHRLLQKIELGSVVLRDFGVTLRGRFMAGIAAPSPGSQTAGVHVSVSRTTWNAVASASCPGRCVREDALDFCPRRDSKGVGSDFSLQGFSSGAGWTLQSTKES